MSRSSYGEQLATAVTTGYAVIYDLGNSSPSNGVQLATTSVMTGNLQDGALRCVERCRVNRRVKFSKYCSNFPLFVSHQSWVSVRLAAHCDARTASSCSARLIEEPQVCAAAFAILSHDFTRQALPPSSVVTPAATLGICHENL